MSAETELLKAVLDDPDADAPRDKLAELLIESGDARGELISVQLKLARNEGSAPVLRKRARALIERHRRAWSGGVADLVDKYHFRRGFAELVKVDAFVFTRIANTLYALAPIRHLTLTGAHAAAKDLFESPYLSRIVSLSLDRCDLTDDDIELLAASPHVRRIRWLTLGWNDIGRRGLDAIAGSDNLRQLQFLGFNDNRIPDPTIQPGGIDETGAVLDVDVDALNGELRATYGDLPWLTYEGSHTIDWPPDRDI